MKPFFLIYCIFSYISCTALSHYRGLSVVDDNVAWMSGSKGSVLRTTNGGISWDTLNPLGYSNRDFRDIHAWDKKKAVVMSAGDSAVLLYTSNAGNSWQTIIYDNTPSVFWDAIDVHKNQFILMGDGNPEHIWLGKHFKKISQYKNIYINRKYFWEYIEETGNRNISFYAASGTVVQWLSKTSWAMTPVVTHAVGSDYLFVQAQFRKQKKVSDPTLKSKFEIEIVRLSYLPFQNQEAGGAYSFRMDKRGHAVAVGGSYLQPNADDSTACYSSDSGKTWLPSQTMPLGYRSCVCQFENTSIWFCTGTNGTDISTDFGVNWIQYNKEGFNSCAVSQHYLWLVGNNGTWARLVF